MSRNGTSFTVGGTINQGIYINRDADLELVKLCRQNAFSYVLTARQLGKSSLMVRTANTLREEGILPIIIDLTQIGTSVTPSEWYLGLIYIIQERSGVSLDVAAWWNAHEQFAYPQRFFLFFKELLEHHVQHPIVVFIDEIDTTLSLDFAGDFFAAIRSIHNERSVNPLFERISFVLIGVATPSDLIDDDKRTPFNIGERVDLTDFNEKEAEPFIEGLGLPRSNGHTVLKWILGWTGGHPYLTQKLCRLVADSKHEAWSKADIDDLVDQTFFGVKSDEDHNLQVVRDMLTKRHMSRSKRKELFRTLKNIIKSDGKVRDNERSFVMSHLKLSGLVKREGRALVVRNPIYSHVFDTEWVKQNSPETWIESNARILLNIATVLLAILFVLTTSLALREQGLKNEAQSSRYEAERSAKEADSLRREAVNSALVADSLRFAAVKNASVADSLRSVAEKNEQSAERSARIALDSAQSAQEQREFAIANQEAALRSAEFAQEQAQIAVDRQVSADSSARVAKEQRRLVLGLALASESIRQLEIGEDTLAALLAREAFLFTDSSGGRYKNEVFNALQRTLYPLQEGRDQMYLSITEEGPEIRDLVYRAGSQPGVLFARNDGAIRWKIMESESDDTSVSNKDIISRSIAINKAGDLVAIAYDDEVKIVSDLTSPSEVDTYFNQSSDQIRDVVFFPGDQSVAFASGNSVVIRDLSLKQNVTFPVPAVQGRRVQALAVFSDPVNQRMVDLYAGCTDNTIWKWNLPVDDLPINGNLIDYPTQVFQHNDRVNTNALAVSPSGKWLAEGGNDAVVRMWDLKGDSLGYILRGHRGPINALAFSDSLLATASGDKTIRLWQLNHLEYNPIIISEHERWVRAVSFSSDGKQLASGSADGAVWVWNVDMKELADEICALAEQGLDRNEWNSFIGSDEAYRDSCQLINTLSQSE